MTPQARRAETCPVEIVLVGAGHAHAVALRLLGVRPIRGARMTLVTRTAFAPYSGMLPGYIAGHYAWRDIHVDAEALSAVAGARCLIDEAVGIDLRSKRLLCRSGASVPYDILSLDTGSTPNTRSVPGADRYAVAVKPIDSFLAHFERVRLRMANRPCQTRVCVVGGGAGGVELALSLERGLRIALAAADHDPSLTTFTLCTAESDILAGMQQGLARRLRRILGERGIAVMTNARVVRVTDGAVHFADRAALPCEEVFWTAEAAAAPWLLETGLKLNAAGFVQTRATLESVSHPSVFASGDIAALTTRTLPKAGVYAVRQGPVLARNFRRCAAGLQLKPYRPQRRVLSLISTGDRYAVGARNGLTFEGAWVWRWKDWIDRRFMNLFPKVERRYEHQATSQDFDMTPEV